MNTAVQPQSSLFRGLVAGRLEAGPRRRRLRSAATVTISTLLALATVAGCGIRLESPAPAALVPDADEISRQAAVADVLLVQQEAARTLPTVEDGSPVATLLTEIDTTSAAQVAALGGEYVSGTDDTTSEVAGTGTQDTGEGQTALPPESVTDDQGSIDPSIAASPTDDASTGTDGSSDNTDATQDPGGPADPADPADDAASTPPAPSVERLVEILTQSADRTRASLSTPSDPALARLYASVATSHLDQARSLAAAAGIEAPATESFTTSLPATLPKNLAAADLSTLVQSEDAAGFAYEVMAARLGDADRAAARERAAVHRARAQTWAELASLDGTATDPRAVAYDLPDAADGTSALSSRETMAALAAGMESQLAVSYATFVGEVEPESRASMLDLLADSHEAARSWGAPQSTFPGMPELAG